MYGSASPAAGRGSRRFELFALEAYDAQPPEGAASIRWRLLTTEPLRTADDTAQMLALYTRRWRIEEWHRVLKSGCDAQGHQHETAQRLKRAIDLVLAWRIHLMTLLGRTLPNLPANILFNDEEMGNGRAGRRSRGTSTCSNTST